MSSNTPCVSWVYSGALPKIPQNRPISECTIWPPISGSESMRTTEPPRRADSMAAVEPAIPAPTTHTSALISCIGSAAGRVTASSRSSVSSCGMSRTLSPLTTVKQENACANGYKPDLSRLADNSSDLLFLELNSTAVEHPPSYRCLPPQRRAPRICHPPQRHPSSADDNAPAGWPQPHPANPPRQPASP